MFNSKWVKSKLNEILFKKKNRTKNYIFIIDFNYYRNFKEPLIFCYDFLMR